MISGEQPVRPIAAICLGSSDMGLDGFLGLLQKALQATQVFVNEGINPFLDARTLTYACDDIGQVCCRDCEVVGDLRRGSQRFSIVFGNLLGDTKEV